MNDTKDLLLVLLSLCSIAGFIACVVACVANLKLSARIAAKDRQLYDLAVLVKAPSLDQAAAFKVGTESKDALPERAPLGLAARDRLTAFERINGQ